MKKTIPFMFTILAIASIASTAVLGNTQTAYAGFDCTLDPEMVDAGTLAVGASVKVSKVIDCVVDDIFNVEIDVSDCGDHRINVSFEDPFPLFDDISSADETIVNNNSFPGKTTCTVIFDVELGEGDVVTLTQTIMVTTPEPPLVGGEFLPIDSAALLLAAAQSPSAWLSSLGLVALGIGAYVFTRNPSNIRNIKVILRDYLDRL